MAFMQPIGRTKNVLPDDLSAWIDQENTLDEWKHLFLLSEMACSGDAVNPQDFKSLEGFSMKAILHKTSIKKRKEDIERPSCAPSLSD